jgi:hypothetical protein
MTLEYLHIQLLSHKTAEHPIRISAKLVSILSNNISQKMASVLSMLQNCMCRLKS